MVFDQQHRAAGRKRLRHGRLRRVRRLAQGVQLEGHGEPEARALAELTFEAEFAAHPGGQLARDTQAEAEAPRALRNRVLGLVEGLEDLLCGLGWHANAGVGDAAVQPNRRHRQALLRHARRRRRGSQRHQHLDRSVLGELDRVVEQVRQQLANAQRVAAKAGRHLAGNPALQHQALVRRPLATQLDHPLEHTPRLESELFQRQVSGFDAREIEQVVEHAQQSARRSARRVGQFALFRVGRGFVQQVQADEHTVQRGADFVADVAEEPGLGLVGGQRGVARTGQAVEQRRQLAALLFQTVDHAVQTVLQLADLVASGHFGADRQVPCGDPSGQLRQCGEREYETTPDVVHQQANRKREGEHTRQHQKLCAAAVIEQGLFVAQLLRAMVRSNLLPQRIRLCLLGIDQAHGVGRARAGSRLARHGQGGGGLPKSFGRRSQQPLLPLQKRQVRSASLVWRRRAGGLSQQADSLMRPLQRHGSLVPVFVVTADGVAGGFTHRACQCHMELAIEHGAPVVAHDMRRRIVPLGQIHRKQGVAAEQHDQRTERRNENFLTQTVHLLPTCSIGR